MIIDRAWVNKFYSGELIFRLPDDATIIDNLAFDDCVCLKEVLLPDTLQCIGIRAFEHCINLEKIRIPDSVKSIGSYAFECCNNLKEVELPKSGVAFGIRVFAMCYALKRIELSNNISIIPKGLFQDCWNLSSVKIPNTIEYFGSDIFRDCSSLMSDVSNYKAFGIKYNEDGKEELWCRDYEFNVNCWSEEVSAIQPCKSGYHFVNNLFSIFNYYCGAIDEDIAIYECEIGERVLQYGDKLVTNKIKPVRRLYCEDVIEILNGKHIDQI